MSDQLIVSAWLRHFSVSRQFFLPPLSLIANDYPAEMLAFLPGVDHVGPYTIGTTLSKLDDVMRFFSFAMTYTPNGAAL